MDTNEIMVIDEVMEVTDEIAAADSGKDFKMAIGIGLAVFAGGMACKYIVKSIAAKIRDKKNHEKIIAEAEGIEVDEIDEEIGEAEKI